MNIYTFGDSVLDSKRYHAGPNAGEIVAKTLDLPLHHYAVDGAETADLIEQLSVSRTATPPTTGDIVLLSIGGNDLLHDESADYIASGVDLFLRMLRTMGAKVYVANIYDPTFGNNDPFFAGYIGIPPRQFNAWRKRYDDTNRQIEYTTKVRDCTAVDLHAAFFDGSSDWYTSMIEPSAKGVQAVAATFLKAIRS